MEEHLWLAYDCHPIQDNRLRLRSECPKCKHRKDVSRLGGEIVTSYYTPDKHPYFGELIFRMTYPNECPPCVKLK